MKNANASRVTELLQNARGGEAVAVRELWQTLYGELKKLAEGQLIRERRNHTLQPTALVNEAYLRLFDQSQLDWQNRGHFFGAAAQAMRRILVDWARSRNAEKRGGKRSQIELGPELAWMGDAQLDMCAIDEALTELAERFPRPSQIVDLRLFAGLSVEETALALEISEPTVVRDWRFARAWLTRALQDETNDTESLGERDDSAET